MRYHAIDPEVMGGKPCIRGMRVTVGMIVESIAAGRTVEDLLTDFAYLEEQDIREALAFAASLAQGREVRLASWWMRLLIDMNLAPRWIRSLSAVGHEAMHWSAVGPVKASDSTICEYAREHGFVLITNDLDFPDPCAYLKRKA
jgi:uncharacterized protein (DUF433 family)